MCHFCCLAGPQRCQEETIILVSNKSESHLQALNQLVNATFQKMNDNSLMSGDKIRATGETGENTRDSLGRVTQEIKRSESRKFQRHRSMH